MYVMYGIVFNELYIGSKIILTPFSSTDQHDDALLSNNKIEKSPTYCTY